MKRENILLRVFRALSGQSQSRLAREIGVHPSLVGQWELGQTTPSAEHLKKAAATAGLTVEDGEVLLDYAETLRLRNLRRDEGIDKLVTNFVDQIRDAIEAACRRVLTLPSPAKPPTADDRRQAEEMWVTLKLMKNEARLAVVRLVDRYQSWALCEKVCDEAARSAPQDLAGAADLVGLALEIANRVRGPEAWRKRVRGYALAHQANILRLRGDLVAADETFSAAKSLWPKDREPDGLLGMPTF